MFDLDQELRAIEEELEKEKAKAWPEAPPIQARLSDFQRKVRSFKKALYNGEVSIIAAKEQLPYLVRVGMQLRRVEGELETLIHRRPVLRRSLNILQATLRVLDELQQDLRAYLDLGSSKDPKLQELGRQWEKARGQAERRALREAIQQRVYALIEEGCRRSQEEDAALADASQKLALEALALQLAE